MDSFAGLGPEYLGECEAGSLVGLGYIGGYPRGGDLSAVLVPVE